MAAIGFVIICFAGSVPAMMLGALAIGIGIGYGISAPCQLNLASSLIPHRYTSVATSVCYTARGIGGFISPVVIGAICSAFGKTQGLFSFQLAAVLLFILVLLMLVYEKKMDIHIS
ncbi:MAG: MFS transporter [Lachnospiraceae bacterium]|nr:MFS transporter [Lachnospiraceae bacterium]